MTINYSICEIILYQSTVGQGPDILISYNSYTINNINSPTMQCYQPNGLSLLQSQPWTGVQGADKIFGNIEQWTMVI